MQIKCPYCEGRFYTEEMLKLHIKLYHGDKNG